MQETRVVTQIKQETAEIDLTINHMQDKWLSISNINILHTIT